MLVQASRFEPGWVGAVVGQVQNDHPTMLLHSTSISTVVFDSAGNVIGGGTGYSTGGLLPGIRAYFSANNGVNSIPSDKAFSASVSVLGRYEQTRLASRTTERPARRKPIGSGRGSIGEGSRPVSGKSRWS